MLGIMPEHYINLSELINFYSPWNHQVFSRFQGELKLICLNSPNITPLIPGGNKKVTHTYTTL